MPGRTHSPVLAIDWSEDKDEGIFQRTAPICHHSARPHSPASAIDWIELWDEEKQADGSTPTLYYAGPPTLPCIGYRLE